MSSAAIGFPAVVAREREETAEEKLTRAAIVLRDGGTVCFKISTRVPAELLPRWKRRAYVFFCREASEKLRVPPKPAMQLTVYRAWARALDECRTSDDQLLVMPFERSYSPDVLDVTIECRPKDPADAKRYEILRSVFGDYTGGAAISVDDVERITSDLTDIRRMTEPRL